MSLWYVITVTITSSSLSGRADRAVRPPPWSTHAAHGHAGALDLAIAAARYNAMLAMLATALSNNNHMLELNTKDWQCAW